MITLALDASTHTGSVAVLADGRVIGASTAAMRGRDEERLMPAVDATLREAGLGFADVERIVCGAGPGSFTSLRIAASIAKGVAAGRAVPLFAASSLALIVAGNVEQGSGAEARFVTAIDALRGESYTASFRFDGKCVRQTGALRLTSHESLAAIALSEGADLVGPEQRIAWLPHARGVSLLTGEDEALTGPVDLAAWEPIYGRMAEAQVKWEATHGRPLSP